MGYKHVALWQMAATVKLICLNRARHGGHNNLSCQRLEALTREISDLQHQFHKIMSRRAAPKANTAVRSTEVA